MARRRQLNREKVIARAVEIADQAADVDAVTLAALAGALDVRPPSLYNHVDGLDDLRYAMTVFGVSRLLDTLRQASAGLAGPAALRAMARAYRRFTHDHPGIYPLTIRAPEPAETELVALAGELINHLLLVMATLGLEGDEAVHAIRGLRAILHGYASLEAAEGFKMGLDREESFSRLVDTYLNGLRP